MKIYQIRPSNEQILHSLIEENTQFRGKLMLIVVSVAAAADDAIAHSNPNVHRLFLFFSRWARYRKHNCTHEQMKIKVLFIFLSFSTRLRWWWAILYFTPTVAMAKWARETGEKKKWKSSNSCLLFFMFHFRRLLFSLSAPLVLPIWSPSSSARNWLCQRSA